MKTQGRTRDDRTGGAMDRLAAPHGNYVPRMPLNSILPVSVPLEPSKVGETLLNVLTLAGVVVFLSFASVGVAFVAFYIFFVGA